MLIVVNFNVDMFKTINCCGKVKIRNVSSSLSTERIGSSKFSRVKIFVRVRDERFNLKTEVSTQTIKSSATSRVEKTSPA